MSLDDCKRQVREERRLARQNAIEERLHDHLQQVDDLILNRFGDLDIAYQWINDRPDYLRGTSEYDAYPERGPLIIKPLDRTRKFFMPEGYWCLLEDAAIDWFEPGLRRTVADAHKWHEGDRQIEISLTLDRAVEQCWLICVLGHRHALSETKPTAYLEIRECWCRELMFHIRSLMWHGSDEMRLAVVEPYSLMRTMLPPSSDEHLHISALNQAAEATKARVLKEIELEKKLASTDPAD
ncbi:hypothetical protein SynBIOSE41_02702 [Synechococcus sp. BIOS-E4-1]|nr:hypothetical protein SynBIOSE41_02702 [Synechococcus sp. BIOS-E4-1]